MTGYPPSSNRSRSVQKLDEIVAQLLSQRGYGHMLVGEEIHTAWTQLVGEEMAAMSRPGKVRRGVLDIFVSNSTANQELTFRRRELTKQLAETLPHHSITDLRLRVS